MAERLFSRARAIPETSFGFERRWRVGIEPQHARDFNQGFGQSTVPFVRPDQREPGVGLDSIGVGGVGPEGTRRVHAFEGGDHVALAQEPPRFAQHLTRTLVHAALERPLHGLLHRLRFARRGGQTSFFDGGADFPGERNLVQGIELGVVEGVVQGHAAVTRAHAGRERTVIDTQAKIDARQDACLESGVHARVHRPATFDVEAPRDAALRPERLAPRRADAPSPGIGDGFLVEAKGGLDEIGAHQRDRPTAGQAW